MRPFRNKKAQRQQVFLNLAGSIESQLRDAYAKQYEAGLLTQTSLGNKLGVNRSAVNHRLAGRTNMTLKTFADMVWALGQCVEVDIYDPADRPEINHALAPVLEFDAIDKPLTVTESTATSGNKFAILNIASKDRSIVIDDY